MGRLRERLLKCDDAELTQRRRAITTISDPYSVIYMFVSKNFIEKLHKGGTGEQVALLD